MPRKDPGMPYDLAPMLKARFGQPDDCADLVNKYGTYNIQPTSDTENLSRSSRRAFLSNGSAWRSARRTLKTCNKANGRETRIASPFFFSKIPETARGNGLFPKKQKRYIQVRQKSEWQNGEIYCWYTN